MLLLNSFLSLAGLILVPPPIWVILCSVRTVVTTALYKFVLRRDVTALQFIGAGLIVVSIIVAKLGERNQKYHMGTSWTRASEITFLTDTNFEVTNIKLISENFLTFHKVMFKMCFRPF